MRLPLTAALIAVTLLGACGSMRESRLNPLNWFKKSESVQTVGLTSERPADPRPLVQDVVSMSVEPYPGGAIIRATGLPPTQGWWDAELVARPVDENGVLVYEFHVFPPLGATPANLPQSREITVATSLSTIRLGGVSEIVVQGAANARSSRR